MNAATLDLPFQPHPDAGKARAFVLAIVMHGLLFAFLYFGIRWQNQEPAPAAADLWTALPPMSAPQPRVTPEPPKPVAVEPAPPPPLKADIEQKVEKKKPELKKEPPPPKKEEPKKEPPPKKEVAKPVPKVPDDMTRELAKEDLQRQLNKEMYKNDLNRQLDRDSRAVASNGASDAWGAKVAALVRSKVPTSIASAVPGNPTAVFEVTVLPGREVGNVRLIKPSGYPAYDQAAEQAIRASSPLPPPTAGMQDIPRLFKIEATPKEK